MSTTADRYCVVPAHQASYWDHVLEEYGLEALDPEVASEAFELLECLRRAVAIHPYSDSVVVIGPDYYDTASDLIADVTAAVGLATMEGDE